MTLEQALRAGHAAWVSRGEDVTINVGKSILTFHEGELEMIQDDTGRTFGIPKGFVLVEQPSE